MRKVFIVEDDADIREIVLYALRSAGFEPHGFEKAAQFWPALTKAVPDLLLLDIMLPGEDGLSILKKLRGDMRTRALPVIMLTAKGSEFDKVKGLDLGADDYIAKPFGVMELISRVNALLRRTGHQTDKLSYQNIVLDSARRLITVDGKSANLTYKEYELLYFLLLNAGIVMSRDKILGAVWGWDFEGESRTLDMHVRTLRQKLGPAGEHIKTVRNVGYRLGE
ncbi:MAG: response regulator transcription factor [Oscillospiraceae bacterium]|nr:response regulator transcription factor [Oscillospiraceae bacterium]